MADGFNCGSETAEIFEIEIEKIGGFGEEGLGLGGIAAEDGDHRVRWGWAGGFFRENGWEQRGRGVRRPSYFPGKVG